MSAFDGDRAIWASERQVPCIFGRRVGDRKVLGRAQSKPRKSPGEDSRSWTTFEAKEVPICINGGGVSGEYCVCGWSVHRCKKGGSCQGLPTTDRCEEAPLFSRFGVFYRPFVPNFAKVARPLHALTKKDMPFTWTPECQLVFERLKALLTSAPILCYPDFAKPFVLETDASGSGLGAVLVQQQDDGTVKPVAYASRSLHAHENNYGITDVGNQPVSTIFVLDTPAKSLQIMIVPPADSRENLFLKAHGGAFGAHLSDVKVHSQLNRHYWWLGMRADTTRWTRGYLVCATHSTGRTPRPPLTPPPVAGPFDRVGVHDPVSKVAQWESVCSSLHGLFNEVAGGVPSSGPVSGYYCQVTCRGDSKSTWCSF